MPKVNLACGCTTLALDADDREKVVCRTHGPQDVDGL